MRINDIVQNYMTQQKTTIKHEIDLSKRRNTFGLLGMHLDGRTSADFKTVAVSDEVKEKLISVEQSEFLENYGKSDGETSSAIMRKYIASVPESERLDVSWTLNQISLNEAQRLHDIVKENNPGWQAGQPFDREAVAKLISNRLDMQV